MPAQNRRPTTASGRPGQPPRSPAAKLVLRELIEANTALDVQELQDRTLLPEQPVRETLADLAASGLCTAIHRGSDHQSPRYTPAQP